MKFNIDDYKGKYVMHCKTEEEAKDFCAYLDSIGRKWCDGVSYIIRTNYEVYEENTAYAFNESCFTDVDWYHERNYTILEWSDFMNKEFTKANLKTGDVIEFRNQTRGIVILEFGTIIMDHGFAKLEDIQEDLTDVREVDWDIVAVKRPHKTYESQFDAFELEYGTLVYERKEVEEMTLEEVCKLLGKEIKIIK